ncbi:hypothetical protein P9112_006802 [Eukaryota sp. TZLM1-RC]
MPLLGTIVFIFLVSFLCTVFREHEHKSLIRFYVIGTGFCCWLLWFSVYVAQMYPLIIPEL